MTCRLFTWKTSLLAATPFIAFILGYIATLYFLGTSTIIVPSIVGKPLQHALSCISPNGLSLRLLEMVTTDNVAEGTVLSQIPNPGRLAKRESVIFVRISQKHATKYVPKLIGNKMEDLEGLLQISEIPFNLITLHHSSQPNVCFAQHPTEGLKTINDHGIALISSGKDQRIIFPNLIGQSLDTTKEALDYEGIHLEIESSDELKTQHDSSNTTQIVSEQRPIPGSIVDIGKSLCVHLKTQSKN